MQETIEKRKPEKRKVAIALLALLLAIAVAITVAAAYYITTGGPSDNQGRVAKWGVTIQDKTGAGFQKQYENNSGAYVSSINQQQNVLAPGTSGSLLACDISGTPEVKFKVSFASANDEPPIQILGNWDIEDSPGTDGTNIGSDATSASSGTNATGSYSNDFYCPVIFTFTWYDDASTSIKTETVDGTEGFDDASALETVLQQKFDQLTTTYNAGVNLATLTPADSSDAASQGKNTFPTITWAWKFGSSDSTTSGSSDQALNQTNNRDTALGNLASSKYDLSSGSYATGTSDTDGMPTIKSNIQMTIQQVQ
jgi:hypothetical protein